LRLPIIGWFFLKTGCIPVDRSAGMKALRDMRLAGKTLAAKGRSMLIFPQGTRVAPTVDHPFEIGVFALYEATGLPVVPVALNSGHVWPRNSWMKYPGLVTVEFLDPIDPGLDRKSFMATLKQRIEDRMEILDALYIKNQEKA
ncbi:lysophospholipid acyltransferase family protein, partial [Alphaproteobacteria bacterium]|nr:lysophospholipid acyltransferase family protein [Alphaproteobacteria bacterium]